MLNKYMERGTLRKRSKSPVRFRNHTRNNNLTHTTGRADAIGRPLPMNANSINRRNYFANVWSRRNEARRNREYYKATGRWLGEPIEYNPNMLRVSSPMARYYKKENENNMGRSYNWTCGLYGCVKRLIGRGGATRRNRKRKA